MDHLVRFIDVSYSYRGDWLQRIHALKKVDLAVPTGSAFGFLGANGAGKSTSIKLLVGLLLGHRGRIELFGEELKGRESDHTLRQRLGYLPEHPYFYENLQVEEYLRYLGRLSGLDGPALRPACERVYDLLDLGDLRQRKLRSFSKGMRQRFGLAQAILHRPDLLVLDEPFSGLDPLWRARFREVLHLERARGATLLFSSHILSDVEELCDHYAVIDHGTVLEQGALAGLIGQAPLALTAHGPPPPGATANADGTWTLVFAAGDRERVLATVPGPAVVRLERQRQALEDYFVDRIRQFHGAGKHLAMEKSAVSAGERKD